jgi:heme/copper-type cytochrome/quinol oxidase subunit 2
LALKLNRSASDEQSFSFVIATDADLSSDSVAIDGFSFGILYIPSNFDGTQIKFHVCATKGGTYLPVCSASDGTDLTYTVAASKAVVVPPEVFGAAYLKIETVTDQATTDTVITATFKA